MLKVEGFTGVAKSELFDSMSSQSPMDGSTLLSVHGDPGPGLSEHEPMGLVIGGTPAVNASRVCNFLVAESEMTELIEPLDEPYCEWIWYWILDKLHSLVDELVYYRVYDEHGEARSLQNFNTADNSLGRILIISIPPPHTIATLKSRLAGAERIDKTQMAAMKLFKDITGQVLIKEEDDPFFLNDLLTGRSESRPMALIHPPEEVCFVRAFGAKSQKYLNFCAA